MSMFMHTLVVLPTEESQLENNGERRSQQTADDSHCQLHTFVSNFSTVGMKYVFISPKTPVTFAYCGGSCDGPYSLDARDTTYITNDVLIRHLAILNDLALSDDEKKTFKRISCVPVEYSSLGVVMETDKGARKKLLIRAIPRKCGCR